MSRYLYFWAGGRAWPGMRELIAGWGPRDGASAIHGVVALGPWERIGGIGWRNGAVELVDIEPAWPEGEDEAVDGSDEANPPEASARGAAESNAPGVRRA